MKKILVTVLCLALLVGLSVAAMADTSATIPYRVSYYVPTTFLNESGSGVELTVIDNPDVDVPLKNGSINSENAEDYTTKLYLSDSGEVSTKVSLDAQIFAKETFQYPYEPGLSYINEISAAQPIGAQYELTRVYAKSNVQTFDSDIAKVAVSDIVFTNDPEADTDKNKNLIIIARDGSTHIELYYKARSESVQIDTKFFDYDISDNTITDTTLYTAQKGINDGDNWTGTGTKFAFGNVNTGTGLGSNVWNGQELNKYNNNNSQVGGVTFEIVEHDQLDNGLPVFNDGIQSKDYFSTREFNGKTYIEGWQLEFDFSGDTYTLARVLDDNGKVVIDNLDSFRHTTGGIYSNDFWPLDNVANLVDDYGADHDAKFGNPDNQKYWEGAGESFYTAPSTNGTLPKSDDSKAHNNYFGMTFTVDFELDKDYCGPLEYLFFGDDDMWVFLEDPKGKVTQVIDIGGVHSSVGQLANLWDYLPDNVGWTKVFEENKSLSKEDQKDLPAAGTANAGKYRLHFFYTERGASGSTCFMQFTLPSVSVSKTADYRDLVLKKEVDSGDLRQNDTFSFDVRVDDAYRVDGDKIAYTIHNADGGIVEEPDVADPTLRVNEKQRFTLSNGQYIHFKMLSLNSDFWIDEVVNENAYDIAISSNVPVTQRPENSVSGKITDIKDQVVKVTFKNDRQMSSLKLVKTAVDARKDEAFEFSVRLFNDAADPVFASGEEVAYVIRDKEGNKVGDGKLTAGSASTVSLKNGEYLFIEEVYVGAKYEIVEQGANLERFETSSSDAEGKAGGIETSGVIKKDEQAYVVSYTNTAIKGSLRIEKKIDNLPAGYNEEFTFAVKIDDPYYKSYDINELTYYVYTGANRTENKIQINTGAAQEIKLSGGQYAVIENLYDDATVSVTEIGEAQLKRFESTLGSTPAGSGLTVNGEIDAKDQKIEAVYTNKAIKGDLKIEKTAKNAKPGEKFTFRVDIDDPNKVRTGAVPVTIYDASGNKTTVHLPINTDAQDESIEIQLVSGGRAEIKDLYYGTTFVITEVDELIYDDNGNVIEDNGTDAERFDVVISGDSIEYDNETRIASGVITEQGVVYGVSYGNTARGIQLSLLKLGMDRERLEGAEFTLVHDPELCCGTVDENTNPVPDVLTTVSQGNGSYLITGILPDHFYTLTETDAPAWYLKPTEAWNLWFGLDESGRIVMRYVTSVEWKKKSDGTEYMVIYGDKVQSSTMITGEGEETASFRMYIEDKVAFPNITHTFSAVKLMDGREPKDKLVFNFELREVTALPDSMNEYSLKAYLNEHTKLLETRRNDGLSIDFDTEFEYTYRDARDENVYYYMIREILGGEVYYKEIEYDPTEYIAKVEITTDPKYDSNSEDLTEQGQLIPVVTWYRVSDHGTMIELGEGQLNEHLWDVNGEWVPLFRNFTDLPDTGDRSNLVLWLMLLAGAGCAMIALLAIRRRVNS